jgi:hypothetical protein
MRAIWLAAQQVAQRYPPPTVISVAVIRLSSQPLTVALLDARSVARSKLNTRRPSAAHSRPCAHASEDDAPETRAMRTGSVEASPTTLVTKAGPPDEKPLEGRPRDGDGLTDWLVSTNIPIATTAPTKPMAATVAITAHRC